MAAAKGNKYAEKWTEETALEFISKVHQYNIDHKDNYHLGLALIENDGYPDLWAYLAKTFAENDKVFRALKQVEQYLESRIINSTISGEAKSAAMAIFYLKNKHGYVDKQELDGKLYNVIVKKDGGS